MGHSILFFPQFENSTIGLCFPPLLRADAQHITSVSMTLPTLPTSICSVTCC